jgi:hypothetical protein
MLERIFTLKKGTEVPAQFDGVTIPFQVPTSAAEMLAVSNGDEKVMVAIFNQAHALNVQKAVKAEALEEGQTVDGLRKVAADHKYGQVRVRTGTGNGAARVKPATIGTALGDDFLATLTPEQRAMYDAKMAALTVKPATPATTETAPAEIPTADHQSGNGGARPAAKTATNARR